MSISTSVLDPVTARYEADAVDTRKSIAYDYRTATLQGCCGVQMVFDVCFGGRMTEALYQEMHDKILKDAYDLGYGQIMITGVVPDEQESNAWASRWSANSVFNKDYNLWGLVHATDGWEIVNTFVNPKTNNKVFVAMLDTGRNGDGS